MQTLIVVSVPAEKEAIVSGLGKDNRFDVLVGGVGPVAAAVTTAKALTNKQYDLVVSAGIGGGFAGKTEVGALVVANEIVAADLGAETLDGFCSLEELGLGTIRITVDESIANRLTEAFRFKGLQVNVGAILTVSTVTGTAASTDDLVRRVPDATAEAMEGYGVAMAAVDSGVAVLEVRAISNLVGPRDREAWRIKKALDCLKVSATVLSEVLA